MQVNFNSVGSFSVIFIGFVKDVDSEGNDTGKIRLEFASQSYNPKLKRIFSPSETLDFLGSNFRCKIDSSELNKYRPLLSKNTTYNIQTTVNAWSSDNSRGVWYSLLNIEKSEYQYPVSETVPQ